MNDDRWQPPVGAPDSLAGLFARTARDRPDAVAIRDRGHEWTYAEALRAAGHIADRLRDRGVQPGELVGVQAERSARTLLAILGVLTAGAAYVPLDAAYPTDRLQGMVADTAIRLLVGDPEHAERVGLATDAVLSWSEPAAEDHPPDSLRVATATRSRPAYVIFTSGSTGRPKGCLVTNGNVLALLEAALPEFDVGASDRWTLFHSCSFDFSVWEMWGAWATGGTVVVVDDRTARGTEDFAQLLVDERVTVLNQVPSALRALATAHEEVPSTSTLRYVVLGGESVDLATVRRFLDGLDRHPRVVNMYGITETTVHVTFKELTEADLNGSVASPIGRPLGHLGVDLRDDDGTTVAPGETGELWIHGAGVAMGYLQRPELTTERFPVEQGPDGERRYYRSGDLARLTPGGELEYVGRRDDQIQLRGYRIELGEIDAALRRTSNVRAAAATVASMPGGNRILLACVVPSDSEATGLVRALRSELAQTLPRHLLPDRYVILDELPLSPSGKLDRAALGAYAEVRRSRPDRPTGTSAPLDGASA